MWKETQAKERKRN